MTHKSSADQAAGNSALTFPLQWPTMLCSLHISPVQGANIAFSTSPEDHSSDTILTSRARVSSFYLKLGKVNKSIKR